MQHRDTIVIGAGPAGLTAGFYLAYYGFDTLLLEEKVPGGYAAEIPLLENYPGCVDRISGKDLVDKMVLQSKKAGAEINQLERVSGLNFKGKKPVVKTEKSDYSAEAVIFASGCSPQSLGVPGEDQFRGKGISHCAVCDGLFFKEKRVLVVGENRRAAEEAIFLAGLASQVSLVCRSAKLCAEKILLEDLNKHKVEILGDMEIKEIKGDFKVKSVVLMNRATGEKEEIDTDGIFLQLEGIPNSEIARDSGIKVDKQGYIVVSDKGRTNIDRIYAIGDITASPTKLVVTAVAQAAVAALDIFENIKKASYTEHS
ncbi:MAG: FAD-dependent oxidoreductase, partial [Candidatus Aminicenantes bacterium]|nr:FAD-dependent oxidoreductase [Candidatus Aminicenantes bacterium]